MTAETFQKITAAIQSIAVTIGLVVGGWWALKTFIYQNPAFYETGVMPGGIEGSLLKGTLEVNAINKQKRQYEITLNLLNESKTHTQIVNYGDLEVLLSSDQKENPTAANFMSNASISEGMQIPPQESRDFKFLATLEKPGTYLVEANPCRKHSNDCLMQRYITVPKK